MLLELGIGLFKVKLLIGHARTVSSESVASAAAVTVVAVIIVVVGVVTLLMVCTASLSRSAAAVGLGSSVGSSCGCVWDSWKTVCCGWKGRRRWSSVASGSSGFGDAQLGHLFQDLVGARLFRSRSWFCFSCRRR